MDQQASIKDYVGRTRTEDDEVSLTTVRRMAAMLDQEPSAYRRGSEMPESWYAILFGPTALQGTLAGDGHVMTGDFLPPLHNARRMFGGRRVRFHQLLRVGDAVQRVSKLTRAEAKSGRRGPFTLITLVHEISAGAGVALTEEQDLIYREPTAAGSQAAPAAALEPEPQKAPEEAKPQWSRTMAPDPVLLFRYSALTFNGHRIHYDLPYTRDIEGYRALVMNGGLTALLLVETARAHLPGRIAGYEARALHPLFVGESITFNGCVAGDTAELWACGPRGTRAYAAKVLLGQPR